MPLDCRLTLFYNPVVAVGVAFIYKTPCRPKASSMSCPPHTASCPHRNEYKAQLRASIDARKQRITPKWRTDYGTDPRPAVPDDSLDESSDDDPAERPPAEHGRCPPGQSSTKPVRRSETTCLASPIRPLRIHSPPLSPSVPPSCHSESDPPSPQSSYSYGMQLDAPPKIPTDNVAVRSTCPFARRNRYLPLALRSASHWKPTMPPHGNGDESASLQRMISENGTQIPQTTSVEHRMEWSD